jgi:hypothetical protein
LEVAMGIGTGKQLVEDILSHHGVKGQRWGVRRKATVGAQEVVISDKRIGKGIKTSGGRGHPAHSDAVIARTSGQIAKKSGHKALSNQQLQAYNQRLNLEQQAKRLTFQDQNAGKRFVMTLMGRSAKGGVEAGGKAALNSNYVRKKAATGAAALALAL